jgi:hypothetical protein
MNRERMVKVHLHNGHTDSYPEAVWAERVDNGDLILRNKPFCFSSIKNGDVLPNIHTGKYGELISTIYETAKP